MKTFTHTAAATAAVSCPQSISSFVEYFILLVSFVQVLMCVVEEGLLRLEKVKCTSQTIHDGCDFRF